MRALCRGVVTNILFENFYLEGATIGPNINQGSGNNGEWCSLRVTMRTQKAADDYHASIYTGSYAGTSNMLVSNIAFVNFTGYVDSTSRTAAVSCSTRFPCYNIANQNISLALEEGGPVTGANGTCSYTAEGGVYGMTGSGC